MALTYPDPEQEPLSDARAETEEAASEEAASENAASESAAQSGERAQAPEIKPPSGTRRISYNLFSRETRTGRFFRALGRGIVIFVSLVALGALVVYVVMARPAEEQLRVLRSQATQAADDLLLAQKERDLAIEQRQTADTRAEEARERLSRELTRIQVLRAVNAISTAQMAVAAEERDDAERALNIAESLLRQAKPRLDQLDPSYSTAFENLFSLARSDLDRDLTFAAQDLERLRLELSRLDNALQ
jgi:hypothetical protein